LYTDNFFGGIAINHLNHPSLSNNSSIPVKFSLHAGVKLPVHSSSGREISITPVVNFKKQAQFEQLDLGTYLDFEPMVFGIWYRGIPVKVEKTAVLNNDALVFLAGIKTGKLSFGYSYDLTISGLGFGTGGSHEVSVVYDFKVGDKYPHKKKPGKYEKKMPCPKF
jgi:type IX secretion system PorP/SprF family membrane protein